MADRQTKYTARLWSVIKKFDDLGINKFTYGDVASWLGIKATHSMRRAFQNWEASGWLKREYQVDDHGITRMHWVSQLPQQLPLPGDQDS